MNWVKIIAMSKTLSEIKRNLGDDRSLQFAKHCAKLMVCEYDNIHINHWKKELFSLCSWIMNYTIKPDQRIISKDLIDEYYFGACCDTINTYDVTLNIAWEELHLYGKRNTSKDAELFNYYRAFCNKVSKLLAKHTLTIDNISDLADKHITNLYRKLGMK